MMDAAAPGTVLLLLELLDNSSIPLTAGELLTLAVSFQDQNMPGKLFAQGIKYKCT